MPLIGGMVSNYLIYFSNLRYYKKIEMEPSASLEILHRISKKAVDILNSQDFDSIVTQFKGLNYDRLRKAWIDVHDLKTYPKIEAVLSQLLIPHKDVLELFV